MLLDPTPISALRQGTGHNFGAHTVENWWLDIGDTGTPVNNDPIALNDNFTDVVEGASYSANVIHGNDGAAGTGDDDYDPDAGDTISVSTIPVTDPTNGSVTIQTSGAFQYTSNAGATSDSFQYRLLDGNGGEAIGTVNLTIAPGQGGGTQVFNFPTEIGTGAFTFNGNASAGTNVLSVTPADNTPSNPTNRNGSTFLTDSLSIDANTSFATRFQFRIYPGREGECEGGDGMTFMVQGNSATTLAPNGEGAGIGYGGIANSIAVELDTHADATVASQSHVGIIRNGNTSTHLDVGVHWRLLGTPKRPCLDDGEVRTLWVDYDGATNGLSVYLAHEATTTKPTTPLPSAPLLTFTLSSVAVALAFNRPGSVSAPAAAGTTAGTKFRIGGWK